LTLNSWNGKFHLEVHWFHAAHFPLWGHPELLERSLQWYMDFLPGAKRLAESYGQEGARWPKMVGPEGRESPNHINPFILWQQPGIIYLAELCYRSHPSEETLRKYQSLVFETASFLASSLHWQQHQSRYVLGPPVVPPPELWEIRPNNQFIVWKAEETFNPTFELAYWDFGLRVAQAWRERLGMKRQPQWDHVLQNLSRLPRAPHPVTGKPLYLHAENGTDLWTNPKRRIQHGSFLMAKGMLPGDTVDDEILRDTFEAVLGMWDKEQMWGTNFPMLAMTATRLGLPRSAVDCLFLPGQNNNFGLNGHSVQWRIYPEFIQIARWRATPVSPLAVLAYASGYNPPVNNPG
jgi:hypothetical protein